MLNGCLQIKFATSLATRHEADNAKDTIAPTCRSSHCRFGWNSLQGVHSVSTIFHSGTVPYLVLVISGSSADATVDLYSSPHSTTTCAG